METKKRKLDVSDFNDRKKIRKMRKNSSYETGVQAKQLWEDLRKAELDKTKRSTVSLSLFNLITGKAASLVYAHDTSRVIQTFIKTGLPEHKSSVFEEIKGIINEMVKSKFAKFVVMKFLKYGTKEQKTAIMDILRKDITNLVKHKEASEVIEYIYNDFANAMQKNLMYEEFYGPTYIVYKTPNTKNLMDFVAANPDKKADIVETMKKSLSKLVEKNILQLSFVHKLLHDFFSIADKNSKSEIIEELKDDIPHLIHTKNGAKVAMKCLWNATAKDKKAIIKGLKTFVVKICKEEDGHLVMLAIFDCVDDTKLVQKALLDELLKNLDEVAKDKYGLKVLLYLLSPRNGTHFQPDVIKILSEGDNNENSKKESSVRQMELLSYVSAPLIDWVSKNVKKLTSESSSLVFLLAVLTNATGDTSSAMKAVAELVAEPLTSSANRGFHFVDDGAGHFTLKNIIKHDSVRKSKGETVLFSSILLDVVSADNIKSWIHCNKGCFIIITMLEVNDDGVTSKIKSYMSNCKQTLKKLDTNGAKILLKKL